MPSRVSLRKASPIRNFACRTKGCGGRRLRNFFNTRAHCLALYLSVISVSSSTWRRGRRRSNIPSRCKARRFFNWLKFSKGQGSVYGFKRCGGIKGISYKWKRFGMVMSQLEKPIGGPDDGWIARRFFNRRLGMLNGKTELSSSLQMNVLLRDIKRESMGTKRGIRKSDSSIMHRY